MNALKIKEIRSKMGISQTALGIKLGVGLRSIQLWESGKRKISKSAKILLERLIEEGNIILNDEQKLQDKEILEIIDEKGISFNNVKDLVLFIKKNHLSLLKDDLYLSFVLNIEKDGVIKYFENKSSN